MGRSFFTLFSLLFVGALLFSNSATANVWDDLAQNLIDLQQKDGLVAAETSQSFKALVNAAFLGQPAAVLALGKYMVATNSSNAMAYDAIVIHVSDSGLVEHRLAFQAAITSLISLRSKSDYYTREKIRNLYVNYRKSEKYSAEMQNVRLFLDGRSRLSCAWQFAGRMVENFGKGFSPHVR